MRVPVVITLLLSISTHAFAVCEHERNEYADWNSKCEKLSAASCVAGTAGGFFAIATFGLSMIPCATAIATAKNACRIRDEKQQNLTHCEAHQAHLAKQAQEVAQAALEAEQAKQSRIAEINTNFENKKIESTQNYDQMVQNFVNNFAAEGWNMDDPETQELIRTTRTNMEHERDQKLDQLETERKQALSNV